MVEEEQDYLWILAAFFIVALVYVLIQESAWPSRRYLRRAMAGAHISRLEDDGIWFGEIPGFDGVWAEGETRDACQAELEEVLAEWIELRKSRGLPIPSLDEPDIVAA